MRPLGPSPLSNSPPSTVSTVSSALPGQAVAASGGAAGSATPHGESAAPAPPVNRPSLASARKARSASWLTGVALGAALYAAFVAYTGYEAIGRSLVQFRWVALLIALVLSSGNYLLRFLKWQYYLRRLGVTGVAPLDSLLIFLSGFVLTITPGKLGEVFKSAVLERTHGVPMTTTAPVVLAERLTDLIAVLGLVLLGTAAFQGFGVWAAAGAVMAACGLALFSWPPVGRYVVRLLRGRSALGRLHAPVERLVASLERVASPSALSLPIALSFVGWGLEGVGFHVLLRGLDAPVALPFATFFYATATLAGAVVPLPGGLGVTEGLIQQQLVQVAGASLPTATAAMLLIRLATLWWAVVLGLSALACLRRRFPTALRGKSDDSSAAQTSDSA